MTVRKSFAVSLVVGSSGEGFDAEMLRLLTAWIRLSSWTSNPRGSRNPLGWIVRVLERSGDAGSKILDGRQPDGFDFSRTGC